MLIEELKRFAKQSGLLGREDIFHASTGYEFQRKLSRHEFLCVGYILGPKESVFYIREVYQGVTKNYHEIFKFTQQELSYSLVVETVQRFLLNKD